jgi:hypothetical protein
MPNTQKLKLLGKEVEMKTLESVFEELMTTEPGEIVLMAPLVLGLSPDDRVLLDEYMRQDFTVFFTRKTNGEPVQVATKLEPIDYDEAFRPVELRFEVDSKLPEPWLSCETGILGLSHMSSERSHVFFGENDGICD